MLATIVCIINSEFAKQAIDQCPIFISRYIKLNDIL